MFSKYAYEGLWKKPRSMSKQTLYTRAKLCFTTPGHSKVNISEFLWLGVDRLDPLYATFDLSSWVLESVCVLKKL